MRPVPAVTLEERESDLLHAMLTPRGLMGRTVDIIGHVVNLLSVCQSDFCPVCIFLCVCVCVWKSVID